MKKLVLIISIAVANLFIPSMLKGQNSVYIITEVFPATAPFFDSVYVTTPTGSVTAYQIPYNSNVAGHDAALNVILNGVTTLGYTVSDYSYNRNYTAGPQTRFITRWFLKKPWTTSIREMEEAKTSQISVKVYPNPANGIVSVEILSSIELKPLEIDIIDELGYIVFTKMITDYSSNTYTLNTSQLKQGVYLLSVKTKDYYSIPCKLILN